MSSSSSILHSSNTNNKKKTYNFKITKFVSSEYNFDPRDTKICEFYNPRAAAIAAANISGGSAATSTSNNNNNNNGIGNKARHNPAHMTCPNGLNCPNKHILPNFNNKIVCKHWLRGLCKKNNNCEYLHEYNLRKMPECVFFNKNGYCTSTNECPYLHIDPRTGHPILKDSITGNDSGGNDGLGSNENGTKDEVIIEECEAYKQGFCAMGPNCKFKHIKNKKLCLRYLNGFCPVGSSECEDEHPCLTQFLIEKLKIKNDLDINTKKNDAIKEARLNALINGEPMPA
ncbi:related to mRNA 3'-end-processing protein YTH1 [Saccharomycodes ludwigii]|uniref:mRNA 3'-end-processing protein n=1 Tax=Saccharomycodes ludwigii TaxID=36035 RepID=A0A376BBH7_9ASCO|nr:hypothetical protein SCDLUD_000505 [Saccharomycodes ludwigii]KAH3902910.1 hypothetical protein SCDLUD_000505 [Saccharomycodes ludwigii]SSD62043.1 related to mRNA 3'-end-processing protein YTH1 [Saccharomycodes ludwigii]